MLAKAAVVDGAFDRPDGLSGAAWLFLYQPTEEPRGGPSVPAYLTAISAERLNRDPRFVFSDVEPNPWQLFGVLDTDGNFDPTIDVLSQQSAGDRVGPSLLVNVQPGRGLSVNYSARTLVVAEPPAFHLQGADGDLVLELSTGMTPITLVADSVGHFDAQKTQFRLGLVDADGDGQFDRSPEGVPTLSLTVLLRWHPRPGQAPEGTNVVVPTVYNPAPFLSTLNGNLTATVFAQTLQVFPLPQAQVISVDEKGVAHTEVYGSPPRGDYELVAVMPGGQFWRIPNQLGATVPSQGVRLHFDRVLP